MKKRGRILGLVFVLGAGTWLFTHRTPNSDFSKSSFPNSSGPPASTPPTTGMSSSGAPLTPESAPEAPPSERLREMQAEYLRSFPPAFRSAAHINAGPSAPGVWKLEVELSGARLMGSDARLLRNADGSWKLWEFTPPPLPDKVRDFPRVSEAEMEALVREELEKMKAVPAKILALEKRWLPDDAEMTPCQAFQVDYENADARFRQEDWCVQPEQKRVIWKRALGRP